jgi:pimeloyl-ACP methyl ester carboxylesterase
MTKSPFSNNGPEVTENMKTLNLQTAPGMVFDVSVEVDDHSPLVLMLHGFGVSRFFWNAQVHAAADAGYYAVAPNQRGYAAGARLDPADHSRYHVDRLIGDALDIVAAVGHGDRRFHLVGHDWGASMADRGSTPRTVGVAHHPVSSASAGIRTGAGNARWRAAASVGSPSDIPGARRRTEHPGGQYELAADAPEQERGGCYRDRGAPVRHRQPAGYVGRVALVSGARSSSRAGGTDQSANPVHLGRPGRHSWKGGGRRDR